MKKLDEFVEFSEKWQIVAGFRHMATEQRQRILPLWHRINQPQPQVPARSTAYELGADCCRWSFRCLVFGDTVSVPEVVEPRMANRCSTRGLSRFALPKRASSVHKHTGERWKSAPRDVGVCWCWLQSFGLGGLAPLALEDASLPSSKKRPFSPMLRPFRQFR